jgi:flagellar biosynthesis protein FlhF
MRMRTFTAPTLQEAIAQIREDMGPDALILTTHYRRGEVEVRAAVEPALRVPSTHTAASMPITTRRPVPGPAPEANLSNPLPEATPAAPLAPSATVPQPAGWGLRPRAVQRRALESAGDLLMWHGVPADTARGLARAANHIGCAEVQNALAAALETRITFQPIPPAPVRPVMFVGPPSSGRSSVAARLTARAVSASGAAELIALDDGRPHQAAHLGWLSGLGERAIGLADHQRLIQRVERRREGRGPLFIDAFSTNPFDHESVEALRAIVSTVDVEPVLVLSARGHPDEIAETAQVFSMLGVTRLVVTGLDLVRRRGAPVIAAIAGDMKLAQIAIGGMAGVGLAPATPARLARLMVDAADEAAAVRGAA